jgi:DNA invertase Pin-like site-specific DNA recombinase
MHQLKPNLSQIAIGYVRVSTETQLTEGFSLISQIKEIERFCVENGLLLSAIYREVESAKTAKGRPVFQAAIRHLLKDQADTMVFCNWDRFARNTVDSELIRRSLTAKGKRLIATQQRYLQSHFGMEDEELEAALAHAAVDNEKERKKIRKRLVRGMQEKIANGGWAGHRPPYEYDIIQGEPVLNFGRWLIIKKIWRLRRWCNWSCGKIARHLNERGVPAYSARVVLKKRMVPKTTRSDGRWTDGCVWWVVKYWKEGKRQQWRDRYGDKRLER